MLTLEMLRPCIPALCRSMQGLTFPHLHTMVMCVDVSEVPWSLQPEVVFKDFCPIMHLGALLGRVMTSVSAVYLWTRGHLAMEKEMLALSRSLAYNLKYVGLFPNDTWELAPSNYFRSLTGLAMGYELFDAQLEFHNLNTVRCLSGRYVLNDSITTRMHGFREHLRSVLVDITRHCPSLVTLGIAFESGHVHEVLQTITEVCPVSLHFLVIHLDLGESYAWQSNFPEDLCRCLQRAGQNAGLQVLAFRSCNLSPRMKNCVGIPFGFGWDDEVITADAILAWVCRQEVALEKKSTFEDILYDVKWCAVA